jgi:hypothetical protein
MPFTGPQALDLLSLAELKRVVKPHFRFVSAEADDSTQGSNLFNVLIENGQELERWALAHTAEVLVPRQARFLISDVTRLQPLLQGTHAT